MVTRPTDISLDHSCIRGNKLRHGPWVQFGLDDSLTAGVSKGHSDKYEPSSMASGASPDHGHLVAIMTGNTVPDLNTDQSFRRA